jgi:hypothetical protein
MGTRGLTIVTGIAVFLSFGGIVYAAVHGQFNDGGLGGALAVALTFLVFFADRGTAAAALQARLPGEFPGGSEAADLARLRNAHSFDAGLATEGALPSYDFERPRNARMGVR